MRIASNEQGGSRFSVYLFFIFLFLVIHVGFKLVPMYMDYNRMEDEMRTKAGLAQVLKDEEILKDLTHKAQELDIPLAAESFVLERDQERRKMKIRTTGGWDVEVHFLWGAYIRNYHFAPAVEEGFMSINR